MTSTSGLTRPIHRFQTAGATGDRLACPVAEELNSVAHNKQTGEVSPGLGLRFCLSCVISLLVLTAIVHSWVILACVLTGQFSSAHPGPLHRWRKVNNWILYSKKKKNSNKKLMWSWLSSCNQITEAALPSLPSVNISHRQKKNKEMAQAAICCAWPAISNTESLSYGFPQVSQWQPTMEGPSAEMLASWQTWEVDSDVRKKKKENEIKKRH